MKKIISAGHICLDITPVFRETAATKVEDLLKPGKLINMDEADVHTGGSVSNTGLAMKKLGANVALVGKVGKDSFGSMVKKILKEYGADDSLVIEEGASTSYSVILAMKNIDRIFLHHNGANNTFIADDVSDEILKDAVLLHFGYPPLMRKMYLNQGEEVAKLFQRAKELGVATSLDLASVDETSEAGAVDWKKTLEKIIPLTDFFLPSIEELCYMLDRERFHEWQQRAAGQDITAILDWEKDVKPLAEECMKLGAKVLLIKCGAPGLYYKTAGTDRLKQISDKLQLNVAEWADKEGFEKSYVPDRILSGTGAGDTTIAAFLTAMVEGSPLEESLQLAAGTGASCVASYDALSGLLSFEELKAKINTGWAKNE